MIIKPIISIALILILLTSCKETKTPKESSANTVGDENINSPNKSNVQNKEKERNQNEIKNISQRIQQITLRDSKEKLITNKETQKEKPPTKKKTQVTSENKPSKHQSSKRQSSQIKKTERKPSSSNFIKLNFSKPKAVNNINNAYNKEKPIKENKEKPLKTGYFKINVLGDQKIYKQSTRVSFITKESVKYDDFIIPAKTIITGYSQINGDRMYVNFKNVILSGQIKNINNIEIYDLEGIKGLKVNLIEQKNKNRGVKTGGKIATIIANKVVSDQIGQTVSNDAQTYSSEDIVSSFILNKERPCLIKTFFY